MAHFDPTRVTSFTVEGIAYQPRPGTLAVYYEAMPGEVVGGRRPTGAEWVAFLAAHVDELAYGPGGFTLMGAAATEWSRRVYDRGKGSGPMPRHEVVAFIDQDGIARKFPATKLTDVDESAPSTPFGRPDSEEFHEAAIVNRDSES